MNAGPSVSIIQMDARPLWPTDAHATTPRRHPRSEFRGSPWPQRDSGRLATSCGLEKEGTHATPYETTRTLREELRGARAGKVWCGGIGRRHPIPPRRAARRPSLCVAEGRRITCTSRCLPWKHPWETPLETHGVGRASPPGTMESRPSACTVPEAHRGEESAWRA